MSLGKTESQGSAAPTGAPDYEQYFGGLNSLTGGNLGAFAQQGTKPLTTEQLQALGGEGATQRNDIETARTQAMQSITADPNLSVDQRFREQQLTNQQAQDRLNAISKQTEAAITQAAQANNALPRTDLEALAQIYYGGKGQISQQSSNGFNASYSGGGGGF